MSCSNVETVMKIYEALRRKDAQAIAALSRADIQVHQSTELPWGGVYKGPEQAMTFFGKVTSYIDSQVSVERVLDAGDHVAVIGRTTGRVKATGSTFDVPLVHLWKLQEGRIALLAVFLHNPSILPALEQETVSSAL